MGRPVKVIDDAKLAQIEKLAGYGLTEAAIAYVLDMAPATFRRKKDQRRVVSALQRGKAKAEAIVSQALFIKAKTGDVPAIRWYDQTRGARAIRARDQADPRLALALMLGVDPDELPEP